MSEKPLYTTSVLNEKGEFVQVVSNVKGLYDNCTTVGDVMRETMRFKMQTGRRPF